MFPSPPFSNSTSRPYGKKQNYKALWDTLKRPPPELKGIHPFTPYSGFTPYRFLNHSPLAIKASVVPKSYADPHIKFNFVWLSFHIFVLQLQIFRHVFLSWLFRWNNSAAFLFFIFCLCSLQNDHLIFCTPTIYIFWQHFKFCLNLCNGMKGQDL